MKKSVILSIILLLTCYVAYAQISTQEEPFSFRMRLPAVGTGERAMKQFASLDMKMIEQEDQEEEARGFPPRFGKKYEVNYNLDNSGEWTVLPAGDKIWRLVITCTGALSINLLYDKFWLPDGAKFWIYSNDRKYHIGAFTSANNFGGKSDIQGFATELAFGDQVTLEYWLPNGAEEVGVISVASVVHGYRYILLPDEGRSGPYYGQSEDCQVNINCAEGGYWQNEKKCSGNDIVEWQQVGHRCIDKHYC